MAEVIIYWQQFSESSLTENKVELNNRLLSSNFQLDWRNRKKQQTISFFAKTMLGDILEEDFSIPQALSKFQKNQHGKPIIENAGLHFNISHSNDMVVVAICKKASLGIDIQLEKRFSSKLLPKVFTDSEQEAFKTSPNQSSFFFDIWSKKEAAVKATGKGIKTGLSSFSVLKNKIELDQHHLHLEKITLKKGYSAAVAVNHPISKITIKPFSHEV